MTTETRGGGFKYLNLVTALYVASLLIANTVAAKIVVVFGRSIPAGILCFPVAYIVGDVLTEIYGFRVARRVIFYGFICLGYMVVVYSLSAIMQPAPFWTLQDGYKAIFGFVPRIALGSLVAYYTGSILNSYFMVLIRQLTRERFLWMRTIGSTIVGEGVDSILFNLIAFSGVFANSDLLAIMLTGFVMKTGYEIIATPVTYIVIRALRTREPGAVVGVSQ